MARRASTQRTAVPATATGSSPRDGRPIRNDYPVSPATRVGRPVRRRRGPVRARRDDRRPRAAGPDSREPTTADPLSQGGETVEGGRVEPGGPVTTVCWFRVTVEPHWFGRGSRSSPGDSRSQPSRVGFELGLGPAAGQELGMPSSRNKDDRRNRKREGDQQHDDRSSCNVERQADRIRRRGKAGCRRGSGPEHRKPERASMLIWV